jgi:hypothetical protein
MARTMARCCVDRSFNELTIYLDDVDREALQMRERRVPCSKVVQGDDTLAALNVRRVTRGGGRALSTHGLVISA